METREHLRYICTVCGAGFADNVYLCPADGSELMPIISDPLIGCILSKRYRILCLIGRGAMSVVYKGAYEPLERFVAIKMLKSHLVSDPQSYRRFQQEAKTTASLNNPNIVSIFDFGVTEQGVPYLVMEYLSGQSLANVLNEKQRITVNCAVNIFTQASSAFAYAHKKGVIHRDIKPSNIVLVNLPEQIEQTEIVKVVDFGIAKLQNYAGHGSQNLTRTGEVFGTPLYVSPEQALGKTLDGRSDIYALGCVMYETLTGQPPFRGNTPIETIQMQINGSVPPLDIACPDIYIPESVQAIIMKCLAKEPNKRYQLMEDLTSDLQSISQTMNKTYKAAIAPATASYATTTNAGVKRQLKYVLLGTAILSLAFVIWCLVSSQVSKHDNRIWQKHINEGHAAYQSGHLAQAEAMYKLALEEAYQFPQSDKYIAAAFNDLSNLYYVQDKYQAAEHCCKRALALRQKLLGLRNPQVAESLSNLSMIDCALGKWDEAEKLGKRALEIREQVLGPEHADVSISLMGLAELACRKTKYKEAEEFLGRALAIREKERGADHPDVAATLHNLGMLNQIKGNWAKAEELYKRALKIRQQQLGLEHPQVSDTMCALAIVEFNEGKFKKAETLFQDALKIRTLTCGSESSRTAEALSCLGMLYEAQGRNLEALPLYQKALTIRQKIWGVNNRKLLPSLEKVARCQKKLGQR